MIDALEIFEDKAILVLVPEHISWPGDGTVVKTGRGFTVTTIVLVELHPLAVQVIVYVTVPGMRPLFINVWLIGDAFPPDMPETVPLVRFAVYEIAAPVTFERI